MELTEYHKAKFWSRVDVKTWKDCWFWRQAKDKQTHWNFLGTSIYRVVWTIFNGPVPEELWVLHKCNNHACVNPRHLYVGTPKQNVRDMLKQGSKPDGYLKLNADQVREIRKSWAKNSAHGEQTRLAKLYNVSPSLIYNIVYRNVYKHIK